jgi:hypothetical protein
LRSKFRSIPLAFDCPLHGLDRMAVALRSGEAELVGDPTAIDLNWLGEVAGGTPWSIGGVAELVGGVREGQADIDAAVRLGRGLREIRAKADELGLALRSGLN